MNRQQIKYFRRGAAAWLSLPALLLTGCLSDVNSAFHPDESPAVVRTEQVGGLVVADTRFGTIYAPGLNSNADGTCLIVDFTYNASDPANTNYGQTGYYTVTLKKQTPVDQADVRASDQKTDQLLPYEQPIRSAISPQAPQLFAYLADRLFLPSVYTTAVGQQVNWQLTYPPTPVAEQIDGQAVYTLYLRASATDAPAEGARDTTLTAIHAFNMLPFIEELRNRKQWDGRGNVYISVHYIEAINAADSTDFTWAATEAMQIR